MALSDCNWDAQLSGKIRPEIACAVHQCARICEQPKLSHEKEVHRIVRYLIGTRERVLIFKLDKNYGIECFVDADFSRNRNSVEESDPVSVLSRLGFMITYTKFPLYWRSKLER